MTKRLTKEMAQLRKIGGQAAVDAYKELRIKLHEPQCVNMMTCVTTIAQVIDTYGPPAACAAIKMHAKMNQEMIAEIEDAIQFFHPPDTKI